MKTIDTAIVGLGKSGFGNVKDYMYFRSHAYTISNYKKFKLIFAIEKKNKNKFRFEKKYKIKAYNDIKDVKQKIDLVILATNTKDHYKSLKKIPSLLKPKYLICEKPFIGDSKKAIEICNIYKKHNIKLYINYVRRCLPSIKKIKKIISKNNQNFSGNIVYPRGIINNCSHFIDLCIFLFGDVTKVKKFNFIKKNTNYDFNRKFQLNFKKAIINFSPCMKKQKYYLKFKSKKFDIIWKKGEKIQIKSQNKLAIKKKLESGMRFYQYYVMKEFLYLIKNSKSSICKSNEALKTLKVIEEIKK